MGKWVAFDYQTKIIKAIFDSFDLASSYANSAGYGLTTSARRVKVGDKLK